VHELLVALGPCRATALLMFHALTGCDTVSAFVGRGKKTCWEVWQKNPDVTAAFEELGTLPATISPQALALVERYVVLLYDRSCNCSTVNAARKKLFAQKARLLITSHQLRMLFCFTLSVLLTRLGMCGVKHLFPFRSYQVLVNGVGK
jgi:hypothetical protein